MLDNSFEYDTLIVRYLNGEITPEEKETLSDWVKDSKENEIFFVQILKIWEKSTIEFQDKQLAEERVKDFFHEIDKRRKRQMLRRSIVSVAASLLLFVGIRLLYGDLFSPPMLCVNADKTKKEVILPDSSVVWLNAQSSLEYPSKFSKSRKVLLTGEAYFDVKTNQQKPFLVETRDLTIEVVGTRFMVRDRAGEDETETVLESGKVNLTVKNSSEKKIAMEPNQKVTYNKSRASLAVSSVDARNYTTWKDGKLVFENILLRDAFIQLGKWYNTDIECSNPTILNTPVSFTVDNESLDEILDILSSVTSFSWKKTSNNKITIQ